MTDKKKSYSRIMKSSSLIGGAQVINILIGMVRVKFVAVLIGPTGIGLVAMYQTALQLIGTISGLGLQKSAVRDIVQAVNNGDKEQIGRTVLTLRRMCWLTGLLGTLTVLLLSKVLSQMTFNSPDYALGIALAGSTILFANLQGGQMALIQGMRRIGDLAKLNVYGAASGTVISIGFYWWLGIEGIVPAIVLLSLSQLSASWWFSHKIEVPEVSMSWKESFKTAGGMLNLGLAFMWNGLLLALVAYLTRILIAYEIDFIAVGLFSAAFALSGLVVNFVLGAMSADYYPSLTAIHLDHKKMRELVNQQTEIGILLALPGLVATIALAPWAIKIFYTLDFMPAVDLLRWFALGCLARVISWPLGYIILAMGKSRLFVGTETVANILHIGLIWSFLTFIGIKGVAIAFPILYLIYTILMLAVAKHLIGFRWSSGVWTIISFMLPMIIITFAAGVFLTEIPATIIGIILTVGVSLFCMRGLVRRLDTEHKVCVMIRSIPLLRKVIYYGSSM